MKQILQGVEHMHKKRIVHLDLKVSHNTRPQSAFHSADSNLEPPCTA